MYKKFIVLLSIIIFSVVAMASGSWAQLAIQEARTDSTVYTALSRIQPNPNPLVVPSIATMGNNEVYIECDGWPSTAVIYGNVSIEVYNDGVIQNVYNIPDVSGLGVSGTLMSGIFPVPNGFLDPAVLTLPHTNDYITVRLNIGGETVNSGPIPVDLTAPAAIVAPNHNMNNFLLNNTKIINYFNAKVFGPEQIILVLEQNVRQFDTSWKWQEVPGFMGNAATSASLLIDVATLILSPDHQEDTDYQFRISIKDLANNYSAAPIPLNTVRLYSDVARYRTTWLAQPGPFLTENATLNPLGVTYQASLSNHQYLANLGWLPLGGFVVADIEGTPAAVLNNASLDLPAGIPVPPVAPNLSWGAWGTPNWANGPINAFYDDAAGTNVYFGLTDSIRPTLNTAELVGTDLILTYTESLSNVPLTSADFILQDTGGVPFTSALVLGVPITINGNQVTISNVDTSVTGLADGDFVDTVVSASAPPFSNVTDLQNNPFISSGWIPITRRPTVVSVTATAYDTRTVAPWFSENVTIQVAFDIPMGVSATIPANYLAGFDTNGNGILDTTAPNQDEAQYNNGVWLSRVINVAPTADPSIYNLTVIANLTDTSQGAFPQVQFLGTLLGASGGALTVTDQNTLFDSIDQVGPYVMDATYNQNGILMQAANSNLHTLAVLFSEPVDITTISHGTFEVYDRPVAGIWWPLATRTITNIALDSSDARQVNITLDPAGAIVPANLENWVIRINGLAGNVLDALGNAHTTVTVPLAANPAPAPPAPLNVGWIAIRDITQPWVVSATINDVNGDGRNDLITLTFNTRILPDGWANEAAFTSDISTTGPVYEITNSPGWTNGVTTIDLGLLPVGLGNFDTDATPLVSIAQNATSFICSKDTGIAAVPLLGIQTADISNPVIVSAAFYDTGIVATPTSVMVIFSEAIDPATVNNANPGVDFAFLAGPQPTCSAYIPSGYPDTLMFSTSYTRAVIAGKTIGRVIPAPVPPVVWLADLSGNPVSIVPMLLADGTIVDPQFVPPYQPLNGISINSMDIDGIVIGPDAGPTLDTDGALGVTRIETDDLNTLWDERTTDPYYNVANSARIYAVTQENLGQFVHTCSANGILEVNDNNQAEDLNDTVWPIFNLFEPGFTFGAAGSPSELYAWWDADMDGLNDAVCTINSRPCAGGFGRPLTQIEIAALANSVATLYINSAGGAIVPAPGIGIVTLPSLQGLRLNFYNHGSATINPLPAVIGDPAAGTFSMEVFGDDGSIVGGFNGFQSADSVILVLEIINAPLGGTGWAAPARRDYLVSTAGVDVLNYNGTLSSLNIPFNSTGGRVTFNPDLTRQQRVPLFGGWNLISFNVNKSFHINGVNAGDILNDGTGIDQRTPINVGSSSNSLASVLFSIQGQFSEVDTLVGGVPKTLGTNTAVSYNMPFLSVGYGYWVKVSTDLQTISPLIMFGQTVNPAASLYREISTSGYNMIGYFGNDVKYTLTSPQVTIPPATVNTIVQFATTSTLAAWPVPVLTPSGLIISQVLSSVGAGNLLELRSLDRNSSYSYYAGDLPTQTDLRYVGPGYGMRINTATSNALLQWD